MPKAWRVENQPGWRPYLLLALFDRRDGTPLGDLVRSAREGYERSDPEMGAEDNRRAWDEFDAIWNRYTQRERLELAKPATQQQEEDGGAAQAAISAIDATFKHLDESGLFEEGGGLPLYEATKPLAAARVKLAESLPATGQEEDGVGDG